ncbi:hypothetical protein ACFO4L_01360 [Bacillus daqingensis]|uniref:Uncharacterized protein n=1 Tax=Bacillus daqingensis TaxID=872396 RepID=A0ABV9NTH6_9BACI
MNRYMIALLAAVLMLGIAAALFITMQSQHRDNLQVMQSCIEEGGVVNVEERFLGNQVECQLP